jgi:hypothetical protein
MIHYLLPMLKSIVLSDFVIAICISVSARYGCRDAFLYKKSNTRVRKERKELNTAQKLFWIYHPSMAKVSDKYLKLFYTVRAFEILSTIIICALYFLSKKFELAHIILYIIIFRALFVHLPFTLFGVYNTMFHQKNPKNLKGWRF